MTLSNIKSIIWDLDNTLYEFTDAYLVNCIAAAARVMCEHHPGLTADDAKSLVLKSYAATHDSFTFFIDQYGGDPELFHHKFHDYTDETTITACEFLANAFSNAGDLDHVILTHGSKTYALRVLKHIGLAPYFEDHLLFGKENMNFIKKNESSAPFATCLNHLNRDPDDVIVVEDTLDNLRYAKEVGLHTVYIHHGKPDKAIPSYVDYDFERAVDFLTSLEND